MTWHKVVTLGLYTCIHSENGLTSPRTVILTSFCLIWFSIAAIVQLPLLLGFALFLINFYCAKDCLPFLTHPHPDTIFVKFHVRMLYLIDAETLMSHFNCFYYIHQVCHHHGPQVHPDRRDADTKPMTTEMVSSFIRRIFKGVSDTPSIYESCLYTVSSRLLYNLADITNSVSL